MEQVLIGGEYDLLHATGTEYAAVIGGAIGGWGISKNSKMEMVSTGGKIKNLRVELNDTPGGGSKTYKFTLHRAVGTGGWANTSLTCTVGSGDTQASDMVNEVSVAAGDVILLECDPTATPTARYARWSMVFEGDNANESLLLSNGSAGTSSTQYSRPMGDAFSLTENEVRCVCPTSGMIKNLYVLLSNDPGTSPDAYRFTLRIDGVDKALTVTVTANDRTGNNTANEVAVSAGDILTVKSEPLNTPSNDADVAIGMTFVADTNGESIILGGSTDAVYSLGAQYNYLSGGFSPTWTSSESQRYQSSQACTLKKLYILLSGAPGSGGDAYTFIIRRNGTSPASGLEVAITDAATTGNDTVNTVTVAEDDNLDIRVEASNSPSEPDAYWGLVSFIQPAVNYEKALSDTITISDSIVDVSEFYLAIADTVAIVDSISKEPGLIESDTIAIADTLNTKAIGLGRADSITIAETIVKAMSIPQTDTITIADSISKQPGLIKADTITISDAFSKTVAYLRSFSDTIAIVDVFSKAFSFFRSFSDIITIADQARLIYPVRRAVTIARMTIKRIGQARLPYKKLKEEDV